MTWAAPGGGSRCSWAASPSVWPTSGTTAWEAFRDTERYVALAEAAVARGERSAERGPLLTASGYGGLSTALIFFFIEFGWLYLVPGQAGPNRHGPPPR